MSNVSISTNKLTIGYDRNAIQSDLSFDLYEGELVAMIGRNGCGKSTLLRTLADLQPALGGSCTIHADQSIRPIAVVLTERETMDTTTIHDVVAMGRYPYTSFLGKLSALDEQVVASSLLSVGLEGLSPSRPVNGLSDGEVARVMIAKALAQQSPIILLDEPTAHLDIPNRRMVMHLLQRLAHEQQKTILISTHELDLALEMADRILLLTHNGIQLDTPTNLQTAIQRAFQI